MLLGIGPSRLLLNAAKKANSERFPIDEGIIPDKLALYKPNSTKFTSLPMLSGTAPDMEVFDMLKNWRLKRLSIAEGMLPTIPVSANMRP